VADRRDQRVHDVRVELGAAFLRQLFDGDRLSQRGPVRTVGRQGVVGVAAGDYPRDQGDLLRGETVGIAGAVVAFVARVNDSTDAAKEAADPVEHSLALDGVRLDDRTLFRSEGTGLVDDRVRHAHLADLMEKRCELRLPPLSR